MKEVFQEFQYRGPAQGFRMIDFDIRKIRPAFLFPMSTQGVSQKQVCQSVSSALSFFYVPDRKAGWVSGNA
jgi:hypothetical protein